MSMNFAREGSLPPAEQQRSGFVVKVYDNDSCVGGFVVEYGAISTKERIAIPDCVGELIHGYAIAKMEAGEQFCLPFL
jgi:hypothetical protein